MGRWLTAVVALALVVGACTATPDTTTTLVPTTITEAPPQPSTSTTTRPVSTTVAEADIDWLAYVEDVLDFVETNHVRTDEIDWATVRAETLRVLEEGPRKAPALKALQLLQGSVGGVTYASGGLIAAETRIDLIYESNPPAGRRLDGNIGYIQLTGTHPDLDNNDTYVEDVRSLIEFIDRQPVCGWVIDVRDTQPGSGGAEMMTGIAPIFGDGLIYTVEYQDRTDVFTLNGGVAVINGEAVEVDVEPYELQMQDPPVAVLVGVETTGSPLAVPLATFGLPERRTFGTPTGVSLSGNRVMHLPDGGYVSVLAGTMYDGDGQPIPPDRIEPDERILEVPTDRDDLTLEAAEDWLAAIEPCASMPEQVGRTT
jgi:hypothetical protein